LKSPAAKLDAKKSPAARGGTTLRNIRRSAKQWLAPSNRSVGGASSRQAQLSGEPKGDEAS
jgi:hypothetical protein